MLIDDIKDYVRVVDKMGDESIASALLRRVVEEHTLANGHCVVCAEFFDNTDDGDTCQACIDWLYT